MAEQPKKIIEISGKDWASGLASQSFYPDNGLFVQATNFDPFEQYGTFRPTKIGGVSTTLFAGYDVKYFVGWFNGSDSGKSYAYGFGDSSGVVSIATDSLTAVAASDDSAITDVSAQISGITTIRGAIKFKDKMLYAGDSVISSNSIPLASANEVDIVTSGLQAADHIMEIAPDRQCYFTNKQYVGRITNVAGTSGNNATYLTFEDDVVTRDIDNDGKYLIIAGDTNQTSSYLNALARGRARCFVAFWNMKSQDLSQIWEFNDSRIYSIAYVDGEVIVIGADNIYSCSLTSPITPIMPLRGNASLTLNYQYPPTPGSTIKRGNGIVLFTSGNNIYGYGRENPNQKKVFFHLNTTPSGNSVPALFHDGAKLIGSTDTSIIHTYDTLAARNTSTLELAELDFENPYRFNLAKIVMRDNLASGGSVSLQTFTRAGELTVLKNRTVSFTNDGGIDSYIFYPEQTSSSDEQAYTFEDLTDMTLSNVASQIRRFEIWATPVNPLQRTK